MSYTCGTLKVSSENAIDFYRVTVFSETAQNELLRLVESDAISTQGSFKAEIYDSSNGPKISLRMVAGQVLALKQPPKKREPKPSNRKQESPYSPPSINDEIPF